MVRGLKKQDQSRDLREAIDCILQFEACYQLAMLAFERLLWLCRHHAAASIKFSELDGDTVLQSVREHLPALVSRFIDTLDNGADTAFRLNLDRLADIRKFLVEAGAATGDIHAFVSTFIARHSDVQHGKFDRGRRKMPWIERIDTRINLTMTRAGGLNWEATLPEHIAPHPYRLNAADALNLASTKASRA
jgi:hypothetical protein